MEGKKISLTEVNKVLETEKEAEKIISNAYKKKEKILSKAKQEALAKLTREKELINSKLNKKVEQEKKKLQQKQKNILDEAQIQVASLEKFAKKNTGKAEKIILDFILEEKE